MLSAASVVAGGAWFVASRIHSSPTHPVCTVAGSAGAYALDIPQAANATTIAAVGQRMGLPNHAVTIALATALQESKLRNLDHGDLDSIGLFQQRPSQGWGPPSVLLVPRLAAAAFY
ncbi:MAG: heavy metal transporter, partial [Acidimicrobiales bacterium]